MSGFPLEALLTADKCNLKHDEQFAATKNKSKMSFIVLRSLL